MNYHRWGRNPTTDKAFALEVRRHYAACVSYADAVVESIDLFPTLCELANLPTPEDLDGSSLVPMMTDPSTPGHPAFSYIHSAVTVRTKTHRLVLHKDQ